MKKLNALFLIAIFAVSLLVCSCSASGQVSTKQQNGKTAGLVK